MNQGLTHGLADFAPSSSQSVPKVAAVLEQVWCGVVWCGVWCVVSGRGDGVEVWCVVSGRGDGVDAAWGDAQHDRVDVWFVWRQEPPGSAHVGLDLPLEGSNLRPLQSNLEKYISGKVLVILPLQSNLGKYLPPRQGKIKVFLLKKKLKIFLRLTLVGVFRSRTKLKTKLNKNKSIRF